ncbi:MAG: hypothetical protein ABL897_11140 [Hyphomicrobium sp.]
MQNEVQALLKALLAEQQRERDFYQSLLAAMSVSAVARKQMLEDVVRASRTAIAADVDVNRSTKGSAEDHLTEAIRRMAQDRQSMFTQLN